MVPFCHQTAQSLAGVMAAIARTGDRAHAGSLVLAKIVSLLQEARHCACVYARHKHEAAQGTA